VSAAAGAGMIGAVGAGLTLGWARLRQHRGTTAALSVLVAMAVGVVLASFAGARRTDAALPAMLRDHRASDAFVTFIPAVFGGSTSPDLAPELAKIRSLPGVRDAKRLTNAVVFTSDRGRPSGRHVLSYVSIDDGGNAAIGHPFVVAGRLPHDDAIDEIAVDEELARDARLHVGSSYPVQAFTYEQADEILQPDARPEGIRVDTRVTAIVRQPYDLRDLQAPRNASDIYSGHYDMYLSAALWRKSGGDMFGYNPTIAVTLDRGDAGLAAFRDAASSSLGSVGSVADIISRVDFLAGGGTLVGVTRAMSLQSRALQAFGILAALVGFFLIGQTLGRQLQLEGADDPVFRAVGMTPAQLRVAAFLRSAAAAVLGTLLGVGVALALSPLTPLPGSTARRAIRSTGVHADWTVLVLGALAGAIVVTLSVALPALRAGRRGEAATVERRTVASRLAAMGLPAPGTVGVRFALEPGRGRRALPVRAAIATSAAAVAVVLSAGVFASSLHTLRHDPKLYGVTWDVSVGGAASPEESDADMHKLQAVSGIGEYSGGNSALINVGGHQVSTLFIRADRGRVTPRIVEGRAPVKDDELALGADTMKQLEAHVGGTITAVGPHNVPVRMRVVGRVIMNASGIERVLTLGKGALADWSAGRRLFLPALTEAAAPQMFLVRYAPGTDRAATRAKLEDAFPTTTLGAVEPADLENLGDVVNLPLAFAIVVALLGIGTSAHAMVSAVHRRSHEIAVLKTLGFARRQVRHVITWQALTFAVLALVVGVPVGIAAGRTAWAVAASQLGVVDRVTMPLVAAFAGCAALVAAMLLVALVPAHLARRVPVATVLRRD
jgi:ABC-type lipoprotein release transport system permease subunit